jgi:hypothetical protein
MRFVGTVLLLQDVGISGCLGMRPDGAGAGPAAEGALTAQSPV